MPLQTHDSAKLEQFFADIAKFEKAYRRAAIKLLAIRGKSEFEVHLGRIELCAFPEDPLHSEFRTADIYCAAGNGLGIAKSPRDAVKALLSGALEFQSNAFLFPADHSGNHSVHS